LIAILLSLPAQLAAQTDSSPFRPLPLPTPNEYRSASGAPGHRYWQNRADYTIEATLDTLAHEIRAAGSIRYRNNSPDTLSFIWLQLDQNIFGENSINRSAPPPPLIFAGVPFIVAVSGPVGGFTLEQITTDHGRATTYLWDTMLRLDLERPLPPGDSARISLSWRFIIPENGAARMGRDGRLYEVAQWYPRPAVYDDVNGWNTLPYFGPGEFYLEYGSFDVRITVPPTFLVAATGELRNADTVLTTDQRSRLAQAMAGDRPVAVIGAGEAADLLRTRPNVSGNLTWHFTAANVRDFAFAAGSGLQWDAMRFDAGGEGQRLVQVFYRPGAANWGEAIRMAHHAIRDFSERWFTYPWPVATVFEGPIQGMEYPGIVFVPADTSRHGLSWVLMHELGHQWFPMVVGSDERRYPWMDEGFNSFIDLYTVGAWWEGNAHADSVMNGPLTSYLASAVRSRELPLITPPAEVRNVYWTGYQKPALMMRLLREEVLGTDVFDRSFREYIRRWQYRHPQPADFFRTMENVSGRDLDWFWRSWVYTTAKLDQTLDSVVPVREGRNAGPIIGYRIGIGYRQDMIMPVELRLTWSDSSVETRRIPVEMWNYGRRFAMTVASNDRRLIRAEVDPREALPDVDRSNNRWPRRR
jgi:hypothetical protein